MTIPSRCVELTCAECGRPFLTPASGEPWTTPANLSPCCCAFGARLIKPVGRAVPTEQRAFPWLPPLSAVTTYIRSR
jgi:hypothetical protein